MTSTLTSEERRYKQISLEKQLPYEAFHLNGLMIKLTLVLRIKIREIFLQNMIINHLFILN